MNYICDSLATKMIACLLEWSGISQRKATIVESHQLLLCLVCRTLAPYLASIAPVAAMHSLLQCETCGENWMFAQLCFQHDGQLNSHCAFQKHCVFRSTMKHGHCICPRGLAQNWMVFLLVVPWPCQQPLDWLELCQLKFMSYGYKTVSGNC